MTLDPTERHEAKTSPMQIAHNPLFSAREKIAMLNEMKAESAGDAANPDHLAYDPEEIDAAISEIRLDVQQGERPEISVMGGADGRND